MRNTRFSRSILSLVLVLSFTSGCQVLYRYRPVAVLVRDAETKKPIADAEVHLSYPLSRDSLAPFDSAERTGKDGIAHLRAAPYGDFGVRVETSSPSYLSEQQSLSTEFIKNIAPSHPFETAERRPDCIVEMYAEPRFSVELVVPVGYRGPIRAEVQFEDGRAVPPGQRCFRYEVQDGFVRVKGPGVLRRIPPAEYRACYTNGTPLPREMTVFKVGFRWVRRENQEECFVIGTQSDYDMLRRSVPDAASTRLNGPRTQNLTGRR